MVIENEKDYSQYIQYMSSLISMLSLLSGFTFTAFTILLAELPDPSNMTSQFTLIFLAALFYQFVILLFWNQLSMIRYCKNVPPLSKGIAIFNIQLPLLYMGLGLALVLMSLIWNLIYLALTSGILWAIHVILFQIYLVKPFREYRKTIK